MTPDEFRDAIARLGLSQVRAAKLFGSGAAQRPHAIGFSCCAGHAAMRGGRALRLSPLSIQPDIAQNHRTGRWIRRAGWPMDGDHQNRQCPGTWEDSTTNIDGCLERDRTFIAVRRLPRDDTRRKGWFLRQGSGGG
jgi:hypothetical protein